MKIRTALPVLFLILSACDGDYEDKEKKLVRLVENSQMGDGSDYWIVKGASFGGPVKIGLIFGYPDDSYICSEIVELMNSREPGAQFYCAPAN